MPGRYAGKRGRLRVISLKNRAGRLLFMALTLIVLSATGLYPPQPCRGRRSLLYLWEGGGASGFFSQVSAAAFKPSVREKPKTWGCLGRHPLSLSQEGAQGCAGMRWKPPAALVPWSELALDPGDPHTPSRFNRSFLLCTNCSKTPSEFSRMEQGRKPEPLIPNPKGALLFFLPLYFFVVFVFNCSAPPLSPDCPLRLTKHFLLVVPSLGCICFGLS